MRSLRPPLSILRTALFSQRFHSPHLSARRSIAGTAGKMSSQREDSIPHELRTAAEPRQNRLFPVRLSHVEQINPSVRLLQLAIPDQLITDDPQPFSFLPGQWLDVHIPSIAQAGGFTITSTPADAKTLPSPEHPAEPVVSKTEVSSSHGRAPYVELAVQVSPSNPSAAWLWKPKEEILGKELNIRVGGSFVWPPAALDIHHIKNVVFIAGGVGINPLVSILSHLNNQAEDTHPLNIHFLYSSRLPKGQEGASLNSLLDQILFLPRLRQIIRSQLQSHRLRISLDLFLTDLASGNVDSTDAPADLTILPRRINESDLRSAVLGGDERLDPQATVAYVCGPPAMTDEMEALLRDILGEGGAERVFFEKWW